MVLTLLNKERPTITNADLDGGDAEPASPTAVPVSRLAPTSRFASAIRLASAITFTATALTACGSNSTAEPESEKLSIVTSLYPLEYLARSIGGTDAHITNLAAPGAEPHDLELTPGNLVAILDADAVIRLDHFQPAIDEATTDTDPEKIIDISTVADLTAQYSDDHADEVDHANESDKAAVTDGETDHGEGEGESDPHFWLDPSRMAKAARIIQQRLSSIDPANKAGYAKRAQQVITDLTSLDTEMSNALSKCASDKLVTAHLAFEYLADRYGFEQVGIAGISPSQEALPARQAEISDFIRRNHITTIYTETAGDNSAAESIANETGTSTAELNTIETTSADAKNNPSGSDYLSLMRSNLATLVTGQQCT